MSSWSTLLAASGMAVDYENKKLSFSPVTENLTFPLVLPDILAKVTIANGEFTAEYINGNLEGWEITIKGV